VVHLTLEQYDTRNVKAQFYRQAHFYRPCQAKLRIIKIIGWSAKHNNDLLDEQMMAWEIKKSSQNEMDQRQ
jgi:hypothetical protein